MNTEKKTEKIAIVNTDSIHVVCVCGCRFACVFNTCLLLDSAVSWTLWYLFGFWLSLE